MTADDPRVKAPFWKANPRLYTEAFAVLGAAFPSNVTTASVPLLLRTIETVSPDGRLLTTTLLVN